METKRYLIVLLCALSLLTARAQERIYVATDRGAYLAGDRVFCSLFCVGEKGEMSDFSAVSYLELISADGTSAEAKIGLFNGRGAGSFLIPAGTPTGNYLLIAYTAASGPDPKGARLISVFNASSTARVKDGVRIVPKDQWKAPVTAEKTDSDLLLTAPKRAPAGSKMTLKVEAPAGSDIVLSVSHDDALVPDDGKSLEAFLGFKKATPGNRKGEYEGEIVLAQVEGLDRAALQNNTDQVTAFLSSAGDPSNVFIGRSDTEGQIRFFTSNIYGNRELVCEVVSMSGQSCHISFSTPFLHPDTGTLPALSLCSVQQEALEARKEALKAEAKMESMDTLLRFMPKREDMLLAGIPVIRYHLDDYTRFPTVREICTEFIPELQFVRRDGRWRIRMTMEDATSSRKFQLDNILVLMDGVVLTNHGMLEDFDAMLLEDVDIYRQAITLGEVSYNGVVNFISKKNYVTALHFPENVRVVDYMGVSYPVAYPGETLPSGKDVRQLLYWNPALEIPEQGCSIPIQLPSYSGDFRITAEGWTPDGKPVSATVRFNTY